MSVVVITPPQPVVTVDELARHLADLPTEDRDYVETLIGAATAWIDGPAGWLGRAIGPQLLEWRLPDWPSGNWRWPIVPFLEVEGVTYIDGVENEQVWPVPVPLIFDDVPETRVRSDAVRIRYWAGYGIRSDGGEWVGAAPPPIKVAIMMLVAQWYNTREAAVVGQSPVEMPFAVDALLQPYRVYR